MYVLSNNNHSLLFFRFGFDNSEQSDSKEKQHSTDVICVGAEGRQGCANI